MHRLLASFIVVSAIANCNNPSNQSEHDPMITVKPDQFPLMTLEVVVPEQRREAFIDNILAFAEQHDFRPEVVRLPDLGEDSLIGGITSIQLTRTDSRIGVRNPFSRERFIIAVSGNRQGSEVVLTVRNLAAAIQAVLQRIGIRVERPWEQHYMD